MKKLILCSTALYLLTSCSDGSQPSSIVSEKKDSVNQTENSIKNKNTLIKVVKDSSSVLRWTGSAVGKSHYGTLDYDGSLNISDDKLNGGELIFDMKTINTKDLEGEWKQKLDNHLMNPDFFNVDSFPTAKLTINEYDGTNLSGDLTIKNITKQISFPAKVTVSENSLEGSAEFSINRTDFGIVYGSGNFFDLVEDKIIADEIEFNISIKASK